MPVYADISELNLSKGMSIRFPDGKDKLLVFEITMKPEEDKVQHCTFHSTQCKAALYLSN